MTYDSTPAPLTLRVGAELVSGPTARKRWVFVRRRRASPSIRLADTQSKAKDADTNFTNSHHLTPRVPSRRLKAIKFVTIRAIRVAGHPIQDVRRKPPKNSGTLDASSFRGFV
jgi:hypothetical protein